MNTSEINNYFKDFNQYYGTYPRDILPNTIPKNTGVIINTDKSSGPGEHWVAVYNCERGAVYFDSFGFLPLHRDIVEFLDRLSPIGWYHNTITFQGVTSATCGIYCIYFLTNYFNGGTYDNFRTLFSFKQNINDLFAEKLYKNGI